MPNCLKPQDFVPRGASTGPSVDYVKYDALLNAVPDAIISTTPTGAIIDFNPAAERMFQYHASELIGANVSKLMPSHQQAHHDGFLRRYAESSHAHVVGLRREIEARRRDGTTFPAELSIAEVRAGSDHFFTGILHDISDRKSYERLLAEAYDQLSRMAEEAKELHRQAEAASRVKSEILTNTSHELRTPLTAILGFAEIIQEETASSEIGEFAENIQRNGRHLLSIVNDILDFASIEADACAVVAESFSPTEMIRELVSSFLPQATAHRCRVHQLITPEVPRQVVSDPLRFRQIIMNLVSNGIRYTEDGDVYIRLLVDPISEPPELVLEVIDTGLGIPDDKLSKLFQPFTQVDASLTRKHGGTGLGLAISARLVHLLGGTIGVQSTLGRGSTFTVRLPLVAAPAAGLSGQTADAPPREQGLAGRLAGRRLLIVDDAPSNVQFLLRGLAKTGAAMMTAENGEVAVDLVRNFRGTDQEFDAILLDLQMPVMDGATAARVIRSLGFSRPIIAITADAHDDARVRALAAGCDELLTKPVSRRDVVDGLIRCMTPRPERAETTSDSPG